jgi:hypothetical protein
MHFFPSVITDFMSIHLCVSVLSSVNLLNSVGFVTRFHIKEFVLQVVREDFLLVVQFCFPWSSGVAYKFARKHLVLRKVSS